MPDERWLVIGLGNPGPRYARTRHNVGFMVADVLARRCAVRFRPHRARAEIAEARLADHAVILGKPLSFMNESGGPVAALMRYFRLPVERLVVVHDELDLPFGSLRVKRGGGDAGHNGLRSITASLRSPDYLRVRVGIGRPPGRMDPVEYVLRDFPASDRDQLEVVLEEAADAVESLLAQGLEATQNAFHGKSR
ncbi:MAG: aminoacyl-tRNA hydrolase [Acidothermus sp.]|nr:aminoacyl-tRNA hydrolase [Acidothermus sp.]